MINGRLKEGDCSLSMTDSSTSEGWAKKTNFKEACEDPIQATVRIEVARGHAMRLMDKSIKDYSQWFAGKLNDLSDSLSRDDDRSDEELTNLYRELIPSQTPEHFEIVPLPKEISSWLTSLLQRLPVKEQLWGKHTRTKLRCGADGKSGATQSASSTTSSSMTSTAKANESDLWEPSPWLCVKQDFQDQLMTPWLKAQSEIPSRLWHRPSGRTIGQTQPKTKMASLADFYRISSERSETRTQLQSNKKPSPSSC